MIVETKRQAYALYHHGKFGNKLRTWDTVRDFVYSGYSGLVTMRYKGTVTGKAWYAYSVKSGDVAAKAKEWIGEGADPMMIVVNESAPDERLVVLVAGTGQRDGSGQHTVGIEPGLNRQDLAEACEQQAGTD